MKFGFTIPDKYLPKALQSDTRAITKVLQGGKKRVSINLVQRRQYVAIMQQDELKIAILMAEDVNRPRRDILYEMYRQAVSDGHFIGEYEKAINKVIGSPFAVFQTGTETIDELATRLLQKNWFEEYRAYLEEADVFWGHSLVQFLEMVPSTNKSIKFEFNKIDLIDREHVRPEEGWIVMDISDEKGIPFRDQAIAEALMLIEMGRPKNLGKLKTITREVIWKNYSRSDWSRHSEKFGMPMVAIKAATTDKAELDKLEQMARDFGNNLWAILDPEDEIDIKEPTFKDSYQIYKEKALFCNSEMSKATTWQTGTSDEKSFAGSAEVHENVLGDYTEWRKRKQTYHVNDVLFPFLIEHGYPLADREFRYLEYKENDPEEDDQDQAKRNGGKKGGGGDPGKKPTPAKARALYKYKV